ncbi:unnamed protein product [Nezara viridula]|uniref:Uncharacterized protein n=1 Tax=Nezara viridula TaxID=85310 RepID=A0A9P0E107_NEZVI|nr:unnamed protein product [Nezara viridula]
MSQVGKAKMPLRKARSTYSLPERMYHAPSNNYINGIKCNSICSNHSLLVQEHMDSEKKAQQANKESVLYTRYLINKISESLRDCLTFSKHFLCLQLLKIPLMGDGIKILGEPQTPHIVSMYRSRVESSALGGAALVYASGSNLVTNWHYCSIRTFTLD